MIRGRKLLPTFYSRPLSHAYAWAPIVAMSLVAGLDLMGELLFSYNTSPTLGQLSRYFLAIMGAVMAFGSLLTLMAFFRKKVDPRARKTLEIQGTVMLSAGWISICVILTWLAFPSGLFVILTTAGIGIGGLNRVRQIIKEERALDRRLEKVLSDDTVSDDNSRG